MNWRWAVVVLLLLAGSLIPTSCAERSVRIGSKSFTESVILGELIAHLARNAGVEAVHQQELGGTRLVFDALVAGEIDVYPEYTGTIREEILAGENVREEPAIRRALAQRGIRMGRPLGFNNTYAIGMKEETAERLGIRTISDLQRHPELRFGFSNEFVDRADGWPSLRDHYGLPQQQVTGMDHDLAYRQLQSDAIQAIDLYSTDADIRYYSLRVLEDDLEHFPTYHAVLLYRADLEQRAPALTDALRRLEGQISESEMIAMNSRTKLERVPETRVAADFLSEKLSLTVRVQEQTLWGRIGKHTKEHLDLVRTSLALAMVLAIPLGIVAWKRPALGQVILGSVGTIQTVPALALLVMLIGPVNSIGLRSIGAGSAPALIALVLYSLLPIVRNTYTALRDIPIQIRESAAGLGLPPAACLWLVELPIASPTILAGIKTAAVINVGFATLGALIGAGGYGQPILTGIRLNDYGLILQGAIPAAVLALAVQGLFELAERLVVPKGLRLKPAG